MLRCFSAGTLVLTEDGQKAIEEIEVGDKVWAYDEETGEKKLKEVVRLFQNTTKRLTTVNIDGVEPIVCTPEHPFYILNAEDTPIVDFEGRDSCDCQGQWITAGNLKIGHKVLLSNGENGIINSVETKELNNPVATYNFEVQDYHTYYVGSKGVLVHNSCVVDTPIDELVHTNGQTMSQTKFGDLIDDIKVNGIKEPVKITEINGTKYILDGNHRTAAARIIGMKTVPTQTVSLPYKEFGTVDDVFWGSAEYISRWRWR